MPTHYDVLQTIIGADDATIKKAYRALALTHHPDKTLHLPDAGRAKREKTFKLTTTAYEVLSDASKRAAYDRQLRATRPVASTHSPEKKQKRPSAKAYTQPPPRPQAHEQPKPPPPNRNGSTWARGPAPKPAQRRPQPSSSPKYPPKPAQPRPSPTSAPQNPPPPQAPQPPPLHPFTTGNPQVLSFTNNFSWDFSLGITKKLRLIQRPILPLLHHDTRGEITVHFILTRDRDAMTSAFMKEVEVNVRKTPGLRTTAMSSLFVETTIGNIEMRISLATGGEIDDSGSWTSAFDADLGFLAGFHKRLRATHLMFWPKYPDFAFTKDGKVPEKDGEGQGGNEFPEGTPMWYVKKECPGVKFVKLSKQFYCEEQSWSSKNLWRVVAVGRM